MYRFGKDFELVASLKARLGEKTAPKSLKILKRNNAHNLVGLNLKQVLSCDSGTWLVT